MSGLNEFMARSERNLLKIPIDLEKPKMSGFFGKKRFFDSFEITYKV